MCGWGCWKNPVASKEAKRYRCYPKKEVTPTIRNEKNLGWLGCIGDEIKSYTQLYREIILNQYKDPDINQPVKREKHHQLVGSFESSNFETWYFQESPVAAMALDASCTLVF